MSDVAIRVENLGKQYRIGKRERYRTFRDSLTDAVSAPFRRLRRAAKGDAEPDSIWALKDVSFEIPRGEVVGIIGRNGAGKSTLLKLLSRITEPTEGRAELHGRVASLLEVGTGFHPELTGRENVYLNGAILGMRKAEIRRKFDEIVAFAEVDRFLDTPVKHYSSGMYVRLAFAVAAHLEPEILVIDEVLAVGDAAFQRKCLSKLGDVARVGRTVLFVSHNMTAIEYLCGQCLMLANGFIHSFGAPRTIINSYLSVESTPNGGRVSLRDHNGRTAGSNLLMDRLTFFSESRLPTGQVRMSAPLTLEVDFSSSDGSIKPVLGVVFKTSMGLPVFGINNRVTKGPAFSEPVREGLLRCSFEQIPLMPGSYWVDLYFGDQYRDLDIIENAAMFEVTPADVFGTGHIPPSSAGPVCIPATYTFSTESDCDLLPV